MPVTMTMGAEAPPTKCFGPAEACDSVLDRSPRSAGFSTCGLGGFPTASSRHEAGKPRNPQAGMPALHYSAVNSMTALSNSLRHDVSMPSCIKELPAREGFAVSVEPATWTR